jgi:ribosomal protein L40E
MRITGNIVTVRTAAGKPEPPQDTGAAILGQQENGYKVCLRCGKLMPSGSSYCNSCGADLSGPPQPGRQGAVSPAQFRRSSEEGIWDQAGGTAAGEQPAAYTARTPAVVPSHAPAAGAYSHYPSLYRQRKTDTLAIASLVCAIASFVLLPLLPAIAAIVTGFMSRERIRGSGGELEGEGMALAGILVGTANLLLLVVVLLVIVLTVLPQ